ncbi:MAG TPA: helicase HerA-like domain-containing protein [Casimicrobiaceae bacterium]|nr:helicase HerA-like domain-containing protein [Casimicrobiaceae bacterium]
MPGPLIIARNSTSEPAFTGFPTVFWDVFGEQGHPVRAGVAPWSEATLTGPSGPRLQLAPPAALTHARSAKR